MRKIIQLHLSTFFLFLFVACQSRGPDNLVDFNQADKKEKESASVGSIWIFHNKNLHGTVGNCGCSMNPEGGLNRLFNFYKKEMAPKKNHLYVDAGNALFAPDKETGAIAKAISIAKAQRAMGIDFALKGAVDKEKSSKIRSSIKGRPWHSSQSKNHPTFKDFDSGKLKLRLIALDQGTSPIQEKTKIFLALLKDTPENRVPIIVGDLSFAQSVALAEKSPRDVFFVGVSDTGVPIPVVRGKGVVVSGSDYKQRVGRLYLAKLDDGKIIYDYKLETLWSTYDQPKNQFDSITKKYPGTR